HFCFRNICHRLISSNGRSDSADGTRQLVESEVGPAFRRYPTPCACRACRLSRTDFDIQSAGLIRCLAPHVTRKRLGAGAAVFHDGGRIPTTVDQEAVMNARGFATRFTFSMLGALAVASLSASPAQAADEHDHGSAPNALVKLVREITEQYKDVAAAKAAGYALAFGCVSGPETGAMGLHY